MARRAKAVGKRYKVFRRTANSWHEFATARKYTLETGLTLEEARRFCENFNANRTKNQIRAGTKAEFEEQ